MTWKETDTDMKYRRLTGVMVERCLPWGCLRGVPERKYRTAVCQYPLGNSQPLRTDSDSRIYDGKIRRRADRLSDGRIKITVYPNSVLGGGQRTAGELL